LSVVCGGWGGGVASPPTPHPNPNPNPNPNKNLLKQFKSIKLFKKL
jgi:hypothetical protein